MKSYWLSTTHTVASFVQHISKWCLISFTGFTVSCFRSWGTDLALRILQLLIFHWVHRILLSLMSYWLSTTHTAVTFVQHIIYRLDNCNVLQDAVLFLLLFLSHVGGWAVCLYLLGPPRERREKRCPQYRVKAKTRPRPPRRMASAEFWGSKPQIFDFFASPCGHNTSIISG